MSRYQVAPAQVMQQRPGPLGQLGNMALQKGLQYGINAALPGGGFAAEAATQILPGMIPRFQEGGSVGRPEGMSDKGWYHLQRKREWEKSQAEGRAPDYSGIASYKDEGGIIPGQWLGWGETADIYGDALARAAKAAGEYVPSKEEIARATGFDPESRAAAGRWWKGALGMNTGGSVHGPMHKEEKAYHMAHKDHLSGVAEYKASGGKVGPLAKTVMKDKDGQMSERHYHNPLMPKPGGESKEG